MTNDAETPGQRVWAVLERFQRGVRGIAELTGVNESTLHNWRADPSAPRYREPRVEHVDQIITALEVQHGEERKALAELRRLRKTLAPKRPRRTKEEG